MRRSVPLACAVLAALLVAADCGGGGGSATAPSPVSAGAGTYTLVQGNGQAPPISVGTTEGDCPRVIESGSLVLDGSGTYSFSLTTRAVCREPGGGTDTIRSTVLETGTWSLSGTALTLQHTSGSDLNASASALSGGSVTTTVQYEWAGEVPAVTLVLRS